MRPQKLSHSRQRGVTLIELMVASIILGIAITGVMTMLGSGRNLDIANSLRRQGRVSAIAILESPVYHYSNYAACLPRIDTLSVTLEPAIPSAFVSGREPAPVPARATVALTDNPTIRWAGHDMASRSIKVNVSWPVGAPTDSVTLVKRIAQAK